jgi:hypothetical protein
MAELNPVRAGLVEEVWQYPLSSAAAHLANGSCRRARADPKDPGGRGTEQIEYGVPPDFQLFFGLQNAIFLIECQPG